MADRYIDAFEVVGYGAFSVAQIHELILPIDDAFQAPLAKFSSLLGEQVEQMRKLLGQSGALEKITYKGVQGTEEDHLAHARDVIRRLVSYASSIKGGEEHARKLLGGKSQATVTRLRGSKLVGAMQAALGVLDSLGKGWGEYASRRAELAEAIEDLDHLDKAVRDSRRSRREMTPEVRELRETFLLTYTAAKHLVRSILTLHGRLELMDDVFDDLADVHKVVGVKDDDPPPAPSA